jgi:hypothetical protein
MIWGMSQLAFAGVQPAGLRHLASGGPGCFEWIRSRASGPGEVSRLPEVCRNLRSDYHQALEVIHRDRSGLVGQVGKTLRTSRSDRSPYEAILFSVLMGERGLLPSLREREKVEKKKKLRLQYASVAVARLEGKACSVTQFSKAEFQELCRARDSVLSEAGRNR